MSCGIESPKQLFRVERRWKGPMLPNGLQTLGGGRAPFHRPLSHITNRQGDAAVRTNLLKEIVKLTFRRARDQGLRRVVS